MERKTSKAVSTENISNEKRLIFRQKKNETATCRGVELVPSSAIVSSSKGERYKTFTLGVIFLFFNGFCNVYTTLNNDMEINEYFTTTLNSSSTDGTSSITKISSVLSWNIIIDYVNYGALTVIVHATVLLLSQQSKWELLWNNIQRMHEEFKGIRRTMGRLTIAGLVIVFSEMIVMIGFVGEFIEMEPGTRGFLPAIFPNVFRLCGMAFSIYTGCSLLLFALIGWTVLLGLRSLQQQAATSSSRTCPSLAANATLAMLAKWKRLHVLLSDVVDGMNECFGPILLIWIIHIFVGFIATPYYIIDEFYRSGSASRSVLPVSFYLMIQLTFHLLIITGIPTAITKQAIAFGKQLQQIDFHDTNHHLNEEVSMLATEVLIALPRITAMEYGDLELSLIPTIIGTTITYLVILCQFDV